MKVRLHVVKPDDMILMVRAAKAVMKRDKKTQNAREIIEFDSGERFEVYRTKTGYSVWPVA